MQHWSKAKNLKIKQPHCKAYILYWSEYKYRHFACHVLLENMRKQNILGLIAVRAWFSSAKSCTKYCYPVKTVKICQTYGENIHFFSTAKRLSYLFWTVGTYCFILKLNNKIFLHNEIFHVGVSNSWRRWMVIYYFHSSGLRICKIKILF